MGIKYETIYNPVKNRYFTDGSNHHGDINSEPVFLFEEAVLYIKDRIKGRCHGREDHQYGKAGACQIRNERCA